VHIADAVFEEVGQAGRAVAEQVEGVGLVGVLGQHDDPDSRVGGPDGVRRADAVHRVGRHPDVGQHRIGPQPGHGVE
jgi:hypothetical protein